MGLFRVGKPLSLILFIELCKFVVEGEYNFKNAEDEIICSEIKLVEITPYRSVSLTELAWQSADACCKKKGRILHTIEKSEELDYPLTKSLFEKIENENDEQMSHYWIGLSFRDHHFRWTYGMTLLQSYSRQINSDKYVWASGNNKNLTSRCVGLGFPEYETDPMDLLTIPCSRRLRFICQKVPQDINVKLTLSGLDLMTIGSAQFFTIPRFPNLKFCTVKAAWPVANAICQSRNWALIDQVLDDDEYGTIQMEMMLETVKRRFMNEETWKTIHSSGNDFCELGKWRWACGKQIRNIPVGSKSGKEDGRMTTTPNKRCLQFRVLDSIDLETSNWTVIKVDCEKQAYVICDSQPKCSTENQYPCFNKEPHYIDKEEGIEEEITKCETAQFFGHNLDATISPNEEGSVFWMSPTKFTWLGASMCCKSKGWTLPAPKSPEELDYLKNNSLSVVTEFCSNEMACDGLWAAATTEGFSTFSPLRFANGKPLPRSIYTTIRADGFTYPSCGRINKLYLNGSQAIYVHAHCLEMNFLVCEDYKVGTKANIRGRSVHNLHQVRKTLFEQERYQKYFAPLTTDEIDNRIWNMVRDFCPEVYGNHFPANLRPGISKITYSVACPYSTLNVFTNKRPKNMIPPSSNGQIMIEYQSQVLKDILLRMSLHGDMSTKLNVSTGLNEGYAYQFLTESILIYSQACPIVPFKFLIKALTLFHGLYKRLRNTVLPEIMTKEQFKWTLNYLGQCRNLSKSVQLKHDACGETIIAKEACTNFICTEAKFESRLQGADLLLDIVWKVFELAHAVCFPAFTKNILLFHKFSMTIVDLWENEDIRTRWSHQLKSEKFWIKLLGPHFEVHLINIERCNQAAISSSFFNVRLPRESVPTTARIRGVTTKPFG